MTTAIELVQTVRKIETDMLTPVHAFLKLRTQYQPFFLLESADDQDNLGRFSYIGMKPLALNEILGTSSLENMDVQLKRIVQKNPLDHVGLTTGIVGHLSYHAIEEAYPISLKNASQIPAYSFHMAQLMVIFDHKTHALLLVENKLNPLNKDMSTSEVELNNIEKLLLSSEITSDHLGLPKELSPLRFSSSFSRTGFKNAVQKAKDYIVAGDAFQIVLSQQFTAKGSVDGFGLYRHLRRINPAPYLSYVKFPNLEVLCSSPEMLVRMGADKIETVPIAGTRPVLDDGLDDIRAEELLKDPKELAEHLMLVDLGRNDLGKVSQPGTVEVTDFCKVKKFSRVMHLVSKVQGRPKPNVGIIQGLMAAFPAGTVTGAPKLRAMEIIDELEPVPRNLYAGSVVILDPSGHLNSCIAIRTITLHDNTITIQAGAGIVYDSDPECEYQETLNKARALFNAVEACTTGGVEYDFND